MKSKEIKKITSIILSVMMAITFYGTRSLTVLAEGVTGNTVVTDNINGVVGGASTNIQLKAGGSNTFGLKSDGTVLAAGDNFYKQCAVGEWHDIKAISVGGNHTVGLKSDGTVVAIGKNSNGMCDVTGWKNIKSISAGAQSTVGLKSDGTVVATGTNSNDQCNVGGWSNIVEISAGTFHTVGIKGDGTVVATGAADNGQCNVSEWKDIVAIALGITHTVGLKSDGTVVATGSDEFGQCKVSEWKDIVAISAIGYNTFGLKKDGSVVAIGYNYYGQCEVSEWKGIVAISTGMFHTVGLKSDGTIVTTAYNNDGQGNVGDWKLDVTAPLVTLNGSDTVQVVTDNVYKDEGITVSDNFNKVEDIKITETLNGQPVDDIDNIVLSKIGENIIQYTATDTSGNSSSITGTVNVTYPYSGILQPINSDGSSVFKAGRTVPVKFQLKDVNGACVSTAVAKLSYAKITNNVVGVVNEAESTSAATTGNLFKYDATSNQYIFNLSTKGLTAGTYNLIIELDDGNKYEVKIGVR